jgi:type VI secretion system protein ImpJ
MANTQKILWDEGMLLGPQHFQQWDRFHEATLRQRLRTIRPLDWGLRSLEIDHEALIGGQFALRNCSAVMRDGTFCDAPERDPLPPARKLEDHFATTADRLGVHLAIPTLRGSGLACSDGKATDVPTPFLRRSVRVNDETRVNSEREVATAVSNLRVLFDGEALDDYATVKIAEVAKSATGGYTIEEDYVPPCQFVGVSTYLMKMLRRTLEIMTAKSVDLAGQQRKTGGMAEAAGFWLLHTVNSHLPALQHFFRQERVHPEVVYLELATMAAQLYTFAEGQSPKDLPAYDHDDLGGCFGKMDSILEGLMGGVMPSRCVPIPLEQVGMALFVGDLRDDDQLAGSRFYLGVVADVHEDRVIAELPAKAKISSRDRVQELIMMALAGMGLKHIATPPVEIPVQAGRTYFQFQKEGEHWEAIKSSHNIAIHIPPDFPGLRLELMAVGGEA